MYRLLKKFLFLLPAETSHHLTLDLLQLTYKLHLHFLFPKKIFKPITAMGLQFDNSVGLAAGLDKNADYVDALAMLGFGFIEVGTVTLRPQPGNPKSRLFRLQKDEAIINRMGFNNKGSDYVLANLQKIKYKGILGVNIGKNFDTPNEEAVKDYVTLFQKFAAVASYITINISSPNTKNLRELQQENNLRDLLQNLKHAQQHYAETHKKYVPLIVKISPDLSDDELQSLCQVIISEKIDGLIATNTTISRSDLQDKAQGETGGLSGRPLSEKSNLILKKVYEYTQGKVCLIGSGGLMSAADANAKRKAGATLVQLYSGLIYQGPELIRECL